MFFSQETFQIAIYNQLNLSVGGKNIPSVHSFSLQNTSINNLQECVEIHHVMFVLLVAPNPSSTNDLSLQDLMIKALIYSLHIQ